MLRIDEHQPSPCSILVIDSSSCFIESHDEHSHMRHLVYTCDQLDFQNKSIVSCEQPRVATRAAISIGRLKFEKLTKTNLRIRSPIDIVVVLLQVLF